MSTETKTDDWQACEPGELQELNVRLKRDAWSRQARVLSGAGAAAIAGLLLLMFAVTPGADGIEPISCEVCQSRFDAFAAYIADEGLGPAPAETLQDATLEEVRRHLAKCPVCRDRFNELHAGLSTAGATLIAAFGLTLACPALPLTTARRHGRSSRRRRHGRSERHRA